MKDASLRIKFSACVTIAVLCLAVPILIHNTQQRLELIHANVQQTQATLFDLLSVDAREALETGLYDHLQSRFDQLTQRPDINAIELRDENNKTQVNSPITMSYAGDWVSQSIEQNASGRLLEFPGRTEKSVEVTTPKRLGTLNISFNPALKDAQLQQMKIETGILLVLALFFAIGCAVSVNYFITRRIAQMAKGLIDIQHGNYHPNLSHTSNDELGQLAKHINETGAAVERYEASLQADKEKKIAEQAARTEKEVRSLSMIQNLMNDLRQSIEGTFNEAVELAQEHVSNQAHSLIVNMMNSLRAVDEVQHILEKDELPAYPRYVSDTLTNCITNLERGLGVIASRKQFPIDILVSDSIRKTEDCILIDQHATLRYLTLALEYWPQQLKSFHSQWHIRISVEDKNALVFELKVHTLPLSANQWEQMQQHLIYPLDVPKQERSPLQKSLKKMEEIISVRQSIAVEQNESLTFRYAFQCILGASIEEITEQAKQRFGHHKRIAVVGSTTFVATLKQQFEHLYVDVYAFSYQDILQNKEPLNDQYGLALVDIDSDTQQAQAVLKHLQKFTASSLLRIALSHTPIEQRKPSDKNRYLTDLSDEYLRLPISHTDIARVINSLSANDVARNAILAMQNGFNQPTPSDHPSTDLK
ncbi:HAMP domain-containing protein [Teredinibacter sp. KSP-S5-2]|uniref:HAMP domain-containing protein n=1 Tax=Teredinibacter sp. KSP-S5-2 TaxID=3034506 RepID=UPI002934EC4F|nr:HAMP domain-containing protein [Teredinibacter sp. KSP-S5-2]WNO10463.1 HAMP domain-containing protein [Teredinibacter sp. KSP-S5-2]